MQISTSKKSTFVLLIITAYLSLFAFLLIQKSILITKSKMKPSTIGLKDQLLKPSTKLSPSPTPTVTLPSSYKTKPQEFELKTNKANTYLLSWNAYDFDYSVPVADLTSDQASYLMYYNATTPVSLVKKNIDGSRQILNPSIFELGSPTGVFTTVASPSESTVIFIYRLVGSSAIDTHLIDLDTGQILNPTLQDFISEGSCRVVPIQSIDQKVITFVCNSKDEHNNWEILSYNLNSKNLSRNTFYLGSNTPNCVSEYNNSLIYIYSNNLLQIGICEGKPTNAAPLKPKYYLSIPLK